MDKFLASLLVLSCGFLSLPALANTAQNPPCSMQPHAQPVDDVFYVIRDMPVFYGLSDSNDVVYYSRTDEGIPQIVIPP